MSFTEADWKVLRAVHPEALERFCERVLAECQTLIEHTGMSAHERYLDLFALLQERNREMAGAFDDMRRSRALQRLAAMVDLGMITEDEIAKFSSGVRQYIRDLDTPPVAD
jgi:hypothetical protein